MNKTVKFVLVVVAGLLALFLTTKLDRVLNRQSHPQAGWTPAYTKMLYNTLYQAYNDVALAGDKDKLATCVVGKLKIKYPYGLGGVNRDSLKEESKIFTRECSKQLNLHIGWTPALVNELKLNIRKAAWFQGIKDNYKDQFCDCFIKHLQTMYPGGITDSITSRDRDSSIVFCARNMKK